MRRSKLKRVAGFLVLFFAVWFMSNAAEHGLREGQAVKHSPRLVISVRNNPQQVWRLGLTRGTIELVNSCIRIADSARSSRVVSRAVIFPADFPYRLERSPRDGKWLIKDSLGKKWGAVGERVEIGGGEIKDAFAFGLISNEDQKRCPGPYWELSPEERS